jgi:SAM-dependent methyltransferase
MLFSISTPNGHKARIPTLPVICRPEPEAVRERYARRLVSHPGSCYSPLLPYNLHALQEKERALVRLIRRVGLTPAETKRVLEIGCGTGDNLHKLIQLGFRPENLTGNELLEGRCATARSRLPAATQILCGDASELRLAPESFDAVLQSTVFTSILSEEFQQKLADRMWALAKPGGGILWYDFLYDNPRNPDVRGVPLRRIAALFKEGELSAWKITLAPPIGRLVTKLCPSMYAAFNLFPILRTHVLCWISKPLASPH